MIKSPLEVDVLCVGHACYDLIFSVPKHPQADEKIFADALNHCGGGPAANAAIAITRLGLTAAFSGYLGNDIFGDMHHQELATDHVDTHLVVRGNSPTPMSTILVKADGKRALINYKGSTNILSAEAIDFSSIKPKVILLDGHQPQLSLALITSAHFHGIPTILDAGSWHQGTEQLWDQVDYLVASEKFSRQFANDQHIALSRLAEKSATVVITLGERGLIWQQGQQSGALAAFSIKAIDSTGAGDAFHGAFAAAIAAHLNWSNVLLYSSAAGALCCTKLGAREGLPNEKQHSALYKTCQNGLSN